MKWIIVWVEIRRVDCRDKAIVGVEITIISRRWKSLPSRSKKVADVSQNACMCGAVVVYNWDLRGEARNQIFQQTKIHSISESHLVLRKE